MSNQVIRLRDATAMTPPATGATTEWVSKIGDAMREAVSADDVAAIMKNVVAKAKDGDPKAIQTVLDFVGRNQPRSAPQVVVGVRGQSPSANGNGHTPRIVQQLPPDADGDDRPLVMGASADRTAARDMAQALGKLGPLVAANLAEKSGYDLDLVERLLRTNAAGTLHSWFQQNGDEAWRLTSIGRKELLGG